MEYSLPEVLAEEAVEVDLVVAEAAQEVVVEAEEVAGEEEEALEVERK